MRVNFFQKLLEMCSVNAFEKFLFTTKSISPLSAVKLLDLALKIGVRFKKVVTSEAIIAAQPRLSGAFSLFCKNGVILFLRKIKVFNKSRYSRNRQLYRTGVY